ncbi:MAG: YfiR family protein [Methylococcales bacterium]|nr:YfiR family protein [Methylococcales bacterium]
MAFLYNFSSYVSWPDSSFQSDQSEFTICLNTNQKLTELLSLTVVDEQINNRAFKVIKLTNFKNIENCYIVYISASEYHTLATKLLKNTKLPILFVSDKKDFAILGGMIEIRQDDQHLKLLINLKRVEQSGLKIKSTLLNLATIVD